MSEKMMQDIILDLGNTIAQLNIDLAVERANHKASVENLQAEIQKLKETDKELPVNEH